MRIQRTWLAILIGVALIAALAFGVSRWKREHRQFARTDPWFTDAPEGDGPWTPLPKHLVFPVTRNFRIAAAEQLKERQWARLEYEEAERIAETPIARVPGLTPIMVRGVQVSRYNHEVVAQADPDNRLWVRSEAVSNWPLPMLPRPTIVLLPAFPSQLYVDATVRKSREKDGANSMQL